MDKRVMFAVAGSGKTSYIIDKLSIDKRSLIITYTINNTETLRSKIIKKFGYFPKNIFVCNYFSFLYSFCYKPFISYNLKSNGINYEYTAAQYVKGDSDEHYFDKYKRFYSNRISKYFIAHEVMPEIKNRLSKYFDNIFIDEVQDFAANDFNFLTELSKAEISILFVGDFYQHTFDTSRDGNVGKNLHKVFDDYKKKFEIMGLLVDETSLTKSYRCTPTICDFITNSIGVKMDSHKSNTSDISFIENQEDVDDVFQDDSIIKLFYDKHHQYDCYSENWGKSKGKEYENVCIVLNATTLKKFQSNKLHELANQTRNKLYVACSRAAHNIYFVTYAKIDPKEQYIRHSKISRQN